MHILTLLFLAALLGGLLLQLWLIARQGRHVIAHAGEVPAAFAGRVAPEQHRKAAAYTLAKLGISRWDLALGAVLTLFWTLSGGLDQVDRLLAGLGLGPLWSGIALVLAVFALGAVVELPLAVWRTFGIEQRFGFNRTTPAAFVRDRLLGVVLGLALGIPLLAAILWLMDSAGTTWWLWAWALWMGFSLAVAWAYPTWIAPLFNRFTPLADQDLRQRLEALLERCGFHSDGMFVMDGSRRSSHGNAYFTGFGANKRIVFFDTLLDGLAAEEVEAVLAHELGHFRRRHVAKRLLLSAVLSLLGLALLGWLAGQPWFYQALGVTRSSDAAALVLFLLVAPVFTVFASPVMSRLSRRHEFEADAFAAEHADARHLVSGLVKLYRDNASTLTPDPLYSAFYHSHPPAAVRIAHLSAKL
jgi:STE24 endopeptidase